MRNQHFWKRLWEQTELTALLNSWVDSKKRSIFSRGSCCWDCSPKKNSTFQLDRFLWFHYVLLQSIRITMLHDIFAGWWMAESPKIHGKTGRCQRGIRFGPGWCFRPTRRLCEFEMWIIPCLSHIHSSIIMPYGINHVKYVFFLWDPE